MKTVGRFWNWVKNEDTGQRMLYLDGIIAQESWFGDEVTPETFKAELNTDNGPVTVHINSVGGDCIAASQIYTMLRDYPADVTVRIDGLAASAASVVAMAGDRVCMSPTALMMLHNPWTNACGDSGDMQRAIDLLDEVKESIINAYQLKTGMGRTELSDLMDQETWMNAHRAKELGFCDVVLFEDEEPPEKVAFSYSDRATAVHLMNLVRDSFPPDTVSPEDAAGEEDPEKEIPDEDVPEGAASEEEVTVNDRVKVLATDTRLEYLRY